MFQDESEKVEICFRQHLQNFYSENSGENSPRSRSKVKSSLPVERDERATTPGRLLLGNLKKVSERKIVIEPREEENKFKSNDLTKHFKDFMNSNGSVKRVRSFSQPKDKESDEIREQDKDEECANSVGDKFSESQDQDDLGNKKMGHQSRVPDRYLRRRKRNKPEEDNTDLVSFDTTTSHENEISEQEAKISSSEESGMDEGGNSSESEGSADDSTSNSSSSSSRIIPPQPSYKPKYLIDTASSTYSYYTRVRSARTVNPSHGQNSNKIDVEKKRKPLETVELRSLNLNMIQPSNDNDIVPKDQAQRRRAMTVDRDISVMVTVTERPFSQPKRNGRFKYKHSNSNDILMPEQRPSTDNVSVTATVIKSLDNPASNRISNNYSEYEEIHDRSREDNANSRSRYSKYLNDNFGIYQAKSLDHYLCPPSSSSYTARVRRWQQRTTTESVTYNSAAYSFSRDNWKRTNHRFRYSNLSANSRETLV
jgi:hypothetical protein